MQPYLDSSYYLILLNDPGGADVQGGDPEAYSRARDCQEGGPRPGEARKWQCRSRFQLLLLFFFFSFFFSSSSSSSLVCFATAKCKEDLSKATEVNQILENKMRELVKKFESSRSNSQAKLKKLTEENQALRGQPAKDEPNSSAAVAPQESEGL